MIKSIFKKAILKYFLLLLILPFLVLLYSHRIFDVPIGLTADESAFGYNTTLLAQTGYDENGRHLPIFVLSNNGNDWKQPITQYYLTILFKIFGPSIFLLRFSSVIITLISIIVLFFLSQKTINTKFAVFSVFLFIKGDVTPFHSTGYHGMFLLVSLPVFLIGIYSSLHRSKFSRFLLISFFEAIYFPNGVTKINRNLDSPHGSILLSSRAQIPQMTNLNANLLYYQLLKNP